MRRRLRTAVPWFVASLVCSTALAEGPADGGIPISSATAPEPAAAPVPAAAPAAAEEQWFALENEMKDLVVTASLRQQTTAEAPASVVVVSAAEIQAKGYRTLKAVMRDVPGFNDITDVNEDTISLRGVFTSTSNKILVLVDGHRMNDLILGRYDVDVFFGMDAVERIEFVRGPGSALYGSGALTGVVNIITRKGASIGGNRVKVRAGTSAYELGFTSGTEFGNGRDLLLSFNYLHAPGYPISQPADLDAAPTGGEKRPGTIYSGRYPRNWNALGIYRTENSSLTIRGERHHRTTVRGSTGSFYNPDTEPFEPLWADIRFYADYAREFAWGTTMPQKLTIRPSFHYFDMNNQSFFSYAADDMPPIGTRSGQNADFVQGQLKVTYENQILPQLNTIVGIDTILADFYRSDGVAFVDGEHVITPNGYTSTKLWFLFGTYAQAVVTPMKGLSLIAGGRFDTFQAQAKPRFTARAGVTYSPFERFSAKLLYGQSYLAPMWSHAQSRDPNFQGNPNLSPESFDGYELALRYEIPHSLVAELDLFNNDVHDLINSNPTSKTYENSGRQVYRGFDASVQYPVLRSLKLNASYSLIMPDAQATTASLLLGGKIKSIPQHTFRYGLWYQPLQNLSVVLWGRTYGKTQVSDVITGNTVLDPATTIDASVRYTWKDWEFQVIGTNLLNASYAIGGTISRPMPQPGINVEGLVAYKF